MKSVRLRNSLQPLHGNSTSRLCLDSVTAVCACPEVFWGLKILTTILFLCLFAIPPAQAGATLFLGEPYGYDGTFAGTGHAAVYLSGVCATSPVVLRPCGKGEIGAVLSRYSGIAGYDWIAIPLVPYLYAVEKQEDIPLFADNKLVAFLRDRYRRDHLVSLVPDLPHGRRPGGAWYELIGASYLRTIYAFEIETSTQRDIRLIEMLNDRSNRQRWKLITANCADFAREIINFYYPHSVHRSIIADLGVTTPKQLASTLARYSRKHTELQTSMFVIPQVPGAIARSKRVRGVLEVMLTSKKYMLPIFLFHPIAASAAVAVFIGHWHFNPGKNAPILDNSHQLVGALTPAELDAVRGELHRAAQHVRDGHDWVSLQVASKPALDNSGRPVLEVMESGVVTWVGITRSTILSDPTVADFAASLVDARLRQELKSSIQKTARTDVESDLALLRQLQAFQRKSFTTAVGFATARTSLSPSVVR